MILIIHFIFYNLYNNYHCYNFNYLLFSPSYLKIWGFPGNTSGEESTCQCRRCRFNPWVGKIPWERDRATCSSILAWRIPLTKGAWWATVHGAAMSKILLFQRVVLQLLSSVRFFATPWTVAKQASHSPSPRACSNSCPLSWRYHPTIYLILCCPLFLLPSVFPSIRVFSNKSALFIRWPKYWSFSISSSNEYSGLISFRIDWFDLFACQGTRKSLLQHHG